MVRSSALLLGVLAGALAAQSFEDEFRRGLLALNANDLPVARQLLENASRLQPDNAMVWVALAQTYLRGKDSAMANRAAGRATHLAAPDSPTQHALALFYSTTGDFAQAAAAERQFAAGKAADSQAAARAAALSLQAGEIPPAIQWAQTALRQSDTAELHHLLGQAYAAANQAVAALRELRIAAERDKASEAYVFELGQLQLRGGDFAGALATFEDGCRRFPRSAQLQLAYGVAAYGQRRFADATDAFLRVIHIDPAIEQPYLFLSRVLDQAGDRLPKIVAAYAAWEKIVPDGYLPLCLHAKALGAASADPAEIEPELRRSIQRNDQYWESHFELGLLLVKQRAWQQAVVELSRSIALNPKHAAAHFQLARAYDKLGKSDMAQSERAEHQRLTAAETNAAQAVQAKPLP